jgi:hypothetical protein
MQCARPQRQKKKANYREEGMVRKTKSKLFDRGPKISALGRACKTECIQASVLDRDPVNHRSLGAALPLHLSVAAVVHLSLHPLLDAALIADLDVDLMLHLLSGTIALAGVNLR